MTMRKFILLLVLLGVIAGGLTLLGVWTPKVAPESTKSAAVVTVTREDLTHDVTLNAELKPFQEADLHAKIAGYLKNITVDIGDPVKAGQVIATLDIDELKDDLARTTADYHNAKLDYDRIHEIIKKRPGLLAQEEVDKAYATYEMAKANQEKSKTLLQYATITVPFDGVVTKRFVDPGALVQAGVNSSTQAMPIVHIADNSKLRLIFPVPESVVPQIKVGAPVEVTVQATGQTVHSPIVRLAGSIDSNTRTMATEVDLDNRDGSMTPGMYATVRVALEQKAAVLALPIQAVAMGEKPNVWIINAQQEIEERPVTLGIQTAEKVEITGGLQEGERVLFGSRGVFAVGMKVTPKPIESNPTDPAQKS